MTKHKCILFTLLMIFFTSSVSMASVEVIGSLKQVFTSNPGDVVKGQIAIQNSEETDQEVRIYQTDMLYNHLDQTFYDEVGSNKRTNGNWLQYSPKTVVLKGKETRNIDFEIALPASDTIKGTYWSIIMIEGVTPIDTSRAGELNIRTVTRYAVQLVNEVENQGTGFLRFMEPTLTREEENLYLAIDLVNEGDHYIGPEISMELYDEEGTLVKTLSAPKRGIYPGTSTRFKLDLAGIPSKKTYTAMIVAAGQADDVFGLEYTLYF
ncbi:MAG: hypothetical protein GXY09_04830 [Bacteroidales bacterium]|nr:hypothetical protein [Bacteroidales bacterium]